MTGWIALLDANVLYPAPLRDLFVQLTFDGLFQGKWTKKIHDEWIDALMRREPDRDRNVLEKTRQAMNGAVRGCLIEEYETHIDALELPDPDDRHVLAAAIQGDCRFLVTSNTKDFPDSALQSHNVLAMGTDQFLTLIFDEDPGAFYASMETVRSRLKRPPFNHDEYLQLLERQNPNQTVRLVRKYSGKLLSASEGRSHSRRAADDS